MEVWLGFWFYPFINLIFSFNFVRRVLDLKTSCEGGTELYFPHPISPFITSYVSMVNLLESMLILIHWVLLP